MDKEEKKEKKPKDGFRKVRRFLSWLVLSVLALILLVFVLLQLPMVQNFVRNKLVSYLENKLHTKVAIGKLSIDFPTSVSLQKVYFEDRAKDTLLYGDEIRVDIRMLALLRSKIDVRKIYLDGIVANLNRQQDSAFNFQYIVDTFDSGEVSEDTSSLKISVREIIVNRSHFKYKDLYDGNDLDVRLKHFQTTFKKFDPGEMIFDISLIEAGGVQGYFYMLEPLQKRDERVAMETNDKSYGDIRLSAQKIDLSDIDFQFNSDPSHLKSSYAIGKALLHPKNIDLGNLEIALKDAALEQSDVVIEMASDPSEDATSGMPADTSSPSFRFISDRLDLKNTSFKMDNFLVSPVAPGMDYNHLYFTGMDVRAEDVFYSLDTMRTKIISASLKEQSGLVVNQMNVEFGMTPTGVTLDDLYIKTPGSEIRKFVSIRYPDLKAISENMGVIGLDIDLDKSTIAIKDLLLFAPQLDSQLAPLKNQTLFVDALLSGTLGDLQFRKLRLKGLSGTDINLHGKLAGLPEPDKIRADLSIEKFATIKRDITALLPAEILPDSIQLPLRIYASGMIHGGMNNLRTDLRVKTDLGEAQINGTLADITDQNNAAYDITVSANELQLGTILTNPELGNFTGDLRAEGTGLDPQTANANFEVDIPEIGFHQYNYKNITAGGTIQDGNLEAELKIRDSGIAAAMSLTGNFSGTYPAVKLEGVVDSIDLMAIHYATSPLKYHGSIDADFSNTQPDSLTGRMHITKSIIATKNRRFQIDSISLISEAGDTSSIALNAGFATLGLRGQYKLTQLGDVFVNAINPYFSISDSAALIQTEPYHFFLTGSVYDNPALRTILPDLRNMQEIQLRSTFDSDSGWNMSLTSPHIQFDDMAIDGVRMTAGTQDSALTLSLAMDQFVKGTSISLHETQLTGSIAHNELNMDLSILDKEAKPKYFLKGNLKEQTKGNYVFSLLPDSLRLNYDEWNIRQGNQIRFGENGLLAQNFELREGNQVFSINSDTSASSAPLQIEFSDFRLSTLTGMIQSDTLSVDGILNGKTVIRNMQTQPAITADITIDNLSMYNDTLGVLTAKVSNETADQYHADIQLKGNGNDIALNGDYFMRPENSTFDLMLDLRQFQMKSIEGLTDGAIRSGKGYIYGQMKMDGTLEKPNINGNIRFNQTSFILSQLNSLFKIDDKATAVINSEGIRFNSFIIRDTTNNALTIGGMIRTKDWKNFDLGMTIRANQFHAINSTRTDNNSYYGKLIFSTNLNIKGTPAQPVIDGSFSVNDETSFTIVLPAEDPAIVERDGIVRFVDFNATHEDSLFMNAFDSLETAPLLGYDVSLNIDISKEAVFNLIVDPANGDFLEMRGSGQLSGGIDPSGKINLTGDYEVEEGSYSLSFNFLKRKFLIQKGSKIEWTGDPTKAQVDITAVYQTNTAPYELVQEMLTDNNIYYRQKMPFEVHLKMEGELLKPEISFDIVLPDKITTVSTDVVNTVGDRLAELRQEPSELNKQVFALLLLNRFIGENPFDNSSSQGIDASAFAKQSASRLLSEQLNSLTEGLIQGVDLNFDLATTEDYTTGEKQDRTNLQVGVTKRLLNDRLSVTVGNNFELEGPQQAGQDHSGLADNISINYMLSKDGRYMLRAYRINDYTGALEGYVIETGVSFIITLDYNRLSEIFISKKKREQKRTVRRYNRSLRVGDGSTNRRWKSRRLPVTQDVNEQKDEQ